MQMCKRSRTAGPNPLRAPPPSSCFVFLAFQMVYAARDHPAETLQRYREVLEKLNVAFHKSLESIEDGEGDKVGRPPVEKVMTPMMTAMNSQQQQIAPVGISQQQQIAPVGIIDMSQSSNKLVKRPLPGGPGGARPDAIVPPLPRGMRAHPSVPTVSMAPNGMMAVFIPFAPQLAPRFAPRSTGATQPMFVPQHLMQRKKGETMTTTMTTTPTKLMPVAAPAAVTLTAGPIAKRKRVEKKKDSSNIKSEPLFLSSANDDGDQGGLSFEDSLSALFPDDDPLASFPVVGAGSGSDDDATDQMLHWIDDDPETAGLFD
jgi:hypothetical protein